MSRFSHYPLPQAAAACLVALALQTQALAAGAATAPLADAPGQQGVQIFSDFVQSSPSTGAAPTRRTELRLWHDERTLFVAIRAFDPQPGAIVARQMRRDAEDIPSEDQVTLVVDAEGAGRNGYLFAVNPNGAQFDALIYDGGEMREDWDALWQSEARIEADGWSAQLAIPLRVFGQSDASRWRINAERWMPRGSERVRLAGAVPDKDVFTLGEGLDIPAIAVAQQGWGLRVKPSLRLVGESAAASATGRATNRLAPGLELFHESADGLRTTAALNIDFGEAEADERIVNLSRFALFQPEKREFFLRDAGRFSFGGLVESGVTPYYSRRIGLDAGGRPRGLNAGLKFTGSAAGMDFGAFAVRVAGGPTAPGEAPQPSADMAVLRLAKPVDERQRVGMLLTRGNPQGTAGSSLWGLDYQFRDTRWAGDKTLEANAWLMQSRNTNTATDTDAHAKTRVEGKAWGGRLAYFNLGPTGYIEWQRIGKGFDPAVGFLAEAGVLRSEGRLGWWHRTPGGVSITPALNGSYRRTLDGQERTLELIPRVDVELATGDAFGLKLFRESDRLAQGYAPVPGTQVAAGSYQSNYLDGWLNSARSRPVWVDGNVRTGGYFDGRRNDQILTLGFSPAKYWSVAVGGERNAIHLPSGRFTVKLASLRLDYTPTTRLSQNLLLQWDNLSSTLGVSARLRWQWAPGRELLVALDRLGYTAERRRAAAGLEARAQTRAMVKLVWNIER